MNTAFNSALKQSTAIRKDLSALSTSLNASATKQVVPGSEEAYEKHVSLAQMPAAFGALSASLTAFARVVDEYNALAKQELNPAKQEKAFDRIKNFRAVLGDFRAQFDALKSAREEAAHQQDKAELLRRPAGAASDNPYSSGDGIGGSGGGIGAYSSSATQRHHRTLSASERGAAAAADYDLRENHALREQNFFASTNTALDDYIARGQAVLSDLGSQRDMLKNTQKRMYTVANTLGVSGDTIRMIERRAREDKWIFWAGVVVFVLFVWLVLHYLR